MSELFNNPEHWRDRANKTRLAANRYFVSKSEKQRLLKIAGEYDELAKRAEQWQAASEAEPQDMSPVQTEQATP